MGEGGTSSTSESSCQETASSFISLEGIFCSTNVMDKDMDKPERNEGDAKFLTADLPNSHERASRGCKYRQVLREIFTRTDFARIISQQIGMTKRSVALSRQVS